MLVSPTLEWQDRLSSLLAFVDTSAANGNGIAAQRPHCAQRRRLEKDVAPQPDWDRMYRMEKLSGGWLPYGTFSDAYPLGNRYRRRE